MSHLNKPKKYKKKWGYEIWIENNDKYCGKKLVVLPNACCSVHYHKKKKETFYVLYGELELEYSDTLDLDFWKSNKATKIVLKEGEAFTLEPLVAHRFRTNTDEICAFMEISTNHDEEDSYRIIESKYEILY